MRKISISDMTLKTVQTGSGESISFREKIELAKLLDRMNVDVIELPALSGSRTDMLLVKSICTAVHQASVALPVTPEKGSIESTWAALKGAAKPRLQLPVPMSIAQMEYFWHKKPDKMLPVIVEMLKNCLALCSDVELIADDACRAESVFLYDAIRVAVQSGVTQITLCDTAGMMFPEEMSAFVENLYTHVPEAKNVRLGILCSDEMSMAVACSLAAVRCGISEIKVEAHKNKITCIADVASSFRNRGDSLGMECGLRQTEIRRLSTQIEGMLYGAGASKKSFDDSDSGDVLLNVHDNQEAVEKAAQSLGYTLSEEDIAKVYEAFRNIAGRKETIGARELDSLIATVAMQVPPTYRLHNYVINSVSGFSSSAHLQLEKKEDVLEGICSGDGPIDAAFQCVEKIVGRHYELDDFQIQAVTEGHEAMGKTVVRLKWDGKLYSGCGISTDIIAAGIQAYLNALNKIAYEEADV